MPAQLLDPRCPLPVQDRRKFGALGWNIRYEFTDGDLAVSLAQLKEYLEAYEAPPYRCGAELRLCRTAPRPETYLNQAGFTTAAGQNCMPASRAPPLHAGFYRVLRFLFTEINYGGRVTDDKDRRLINNLVDTFCGPEVLQGGYRCAPAAVPTICTQRSLQLWTRPCCQAWAAVSPGS
jgi:dynein heavy chain